MNIGEIETSITQHFAYLHGVLQNIEKRMIDRLYKRNNKCDEGNIMKIESQLKSHYKLIKDVLAIATNAVSQHIQEVDLQHIINQLKQITDVPFHLLSKTPINENKIIFETENSIVEALNKHCKLEIPSIPELSLVRTESLPENYQIEPLDEKITIPEFSQLKKLLDNCNSSASVSEVSNQSKSARRVKILKIIDPTHFYVQNVSDQSAYEKLSNDIQLYSHEAICPPTYLIRVNEMFMVCHYFDKMKLEKKWYRGVIQKIENVGTEIHYNVLFIDIGHLESHVSIDRIRVIPKKFLLIPAYAIKCSLYGISPVNDSYNKAAIKIFRKFVQKNKIYMMYVMHTTDSVSHVDLHADNSVGEESFSVRNNMIFSNCGVTATESIHPLDQYIQIDLFPKQHTFFYEDLTINKKTIVKVQHINSNLIYVTKFEDGENFNNVLMKEMNNYFNENSDNTEIKRFCSKGDVCAFSISKSWYRGLVVNINSNSQITVFSVDYGFITLIKNIKNIRELPEFFRSSKAQAIKISLVNIKPSNNLKKWSSDTYRFIRQNLHLKIVIIIPVEIKKDIYQAHLYIDDYSFNTRLVDEGYAVFINPNLICQSSKTKYCPTTKSVMEGLRLSLDEQEYEGTSKLMMIEPDPFKVSIQIHKSVSPNCIYVSDMLRMKAKTEFMSKLNDFYWKYHPSQMKVWTKDSLCVVYYEKEKCYFRGYILKILTTEKALVSFYDVAIEEEIPIKYIKPLHPMFHKESAFVFKIKLAGLLPCGGTEVWPILSCQKLFDILHENQHVPFYITLAEKIKNNEEILVELWMKKSIAVGPLSPDRIEIISVNKMLVESGLALPIKGYNAEKEKILAIEFMRQLLKTQITHEDEANNVESDDKNMSSSMEESNQLDDIPMSSNLEKIEKEKVNIRKIEDIKSEKDNEDDKKQNKLDEKKDLSSEEEEEEEYEEVENIRKDIEDEVCHDKDEIKNAINNNVKMEVEDESNNKSQNELKDLEDNSTFREENKDVEKDEDEDEDVDVDVDVDEDEDEDEDEEDEDEDEDEEYDEEEGNNKKEHKFMLNNINKSKKSDLIDWLPALPLKNKTFIGIPTNVDYSANIYLHCKKQGKKTLQYIESILSEYCQKVKVKACDKKWKKGDICIAQYHANNLWYRAKVLAVLNENTVEVQFVDYGNVEECKIGCLKKKVMLNNIPIQSVKCVVEGLIPANGKWKIEDLDKIHLLLVEKECKVTVLEEKDTHLVVSITILEPTRCNLLYYIIHKLGIDLASDPTYSDHFKLSQRIQSPIFSKSIRDIINSNTTFKIKTDHTMVKKVNGSTNYNYLMKKIDYFLDNSDSDEEVKTNINEIDLSSPLRKLFFENNGYQYVPMIIPEDIDTFEVNLCYNKSLTTYYVQLNKNVELKVLNDYYNQYNLLIENLQKEAPKQPLLQNLVSNTPCCSLFSDNIWYRCLIKEVIKTKNPNKVLVHLCYVDYGNDEQRIITLEKCDLRIMKKEWFTLPIFAIKCQLWNIDVDDSTETSKMVNEQMNQKYNTTITLKIKERHENILFVELYTDKNCTELIYSSLIDDGYFQFKEEILKD
ncbi:PREDICTED: uncharacterized protein LOC107072113 [Polistes dominula]|uniref:Uncharacterized protein LOC107072113 n=1 Tax=Polistes dominula TaxID=743375 RepID=A0ABM1J472_POLDO|nr:PREDICTED: uncharacterized protein LOC107072113 [Polistes dominula]